MPTEEDLRKILDAILVEGVTEIECDEYLFTVTSSSHRKRLKILFYGEELVSRRVKRNKIDKLKTEVLEKLTQYHSLNDEYFGYNRFNFGDVNNWKAVTSHTEFADETGVTADSVLYAWETPIDGHYVYVYRDKVDTIKAKYPAKRSRTGTIASGPCERVVLLKTLEYLHTTDPYQMDQIKRQEEVAEQKFSEITGVGDRTVGELLSKEVLTFEGLLDNIEMVKRDYQHQAKKDIKQQIEDDDLIKNDDYVQEIPAKMVVEAV